LSLISSGNEVVGETIKAAPPVGVVGASLAGITLNQWVMIATLVYTVLQIALLIYKFIKGQKDGSK
jgi:ABC-type transport system involved in cytochrome c biogenesis permease subunit